MTVGLQEIRRLESLRKNRERAPQGRKALVAFPAKAGTRLSTNTGASNNRKALPASRRKVRATKR
jgi:hypothetical protein